MLGAVFFAAPGRAADKRITDRSWSYYYEKGKLQTGLEIYNDALFNLHKALRLKPDLYQAAELLGDIYVIKHKRHLALDQYRASLEINDAQAGLHCKIGELYEFHAEKDLALRHFLRAVELEPDHARANSNLVRYFIAQGERQKAQEHFRRGYRAGIARAGPFLKKAGASEKAGDRQAAIAQYEKAIEAGPATLEAYIGLYENYRVLSRYGDAVNALLRLIYMKPDHVMAHVWLGHLYLNQAIPGKSRKYCLDQSEKHLKRAHELDPDDPHPCYILADLYRLTGDDLAEAKYHALAMELEKKRDRARPPR